MKRKADMIDWENDACMVFFRPLQCKHLITHGHVEKRQRTFLLRLHLIRCVLKASLLVVGVMILFCLDVLKRGTPPLEFPSERNLFCLVACSLIMFFLLLAPTRHVDDSGLERIAGQACFYRSFKSLKNHSFAVQVCIGRAFQWISSFQGCYSPWGTSTFPCRVLHLPLPVCFPPLCFLVLHVVVDHLHMFDVLI